jgi:hypothetical protein
MDLSKNLISRLEDIGAARMLVAGILGHSIFDNLSKHNPYWESTDSVACEKLYDTRVELACIEDELLKVASVLKKDLDDVED